MYHRKERSSVFCFDATLVLQPDPKDSFSGAHIPFLLTWRQLYTSVYHTLEHTSDLQTLVQATATDLFERWDQHRLQGDLLPKSSFSLTSFLSHVLEIDSSPHFSSHICPLLSVLLERPTSSFTPAQRPLLLEFLQAHLQVKCLEYALPAFQHNHPTLARRLLQTFEPLSLLETHRTLWATLAPDPADPTHQDLYYQHFIHQYRWQQWRAFQLFIEGLHTPFVIRSKSEIAEGYLFLQRQCQKTHLEPTHQWMYLHQWVSQHPDHKIPQFFMIHAPRLLLTLKRFHKNDLSYENWMSMAHERQSFLTYKGLYELFHPWYEQHSPLHLPPEAWPVSPDHLLRRPQDLQAFLEGLYWLLVRRHGTFKSLSETSLAFKPRIPSGKPATEQDAQWVILVEKWLSWLLAPRPNSPLHCLSISHFQAQEAWGHFFLQLPTWTPSLKHFIQQQLAVFHDPSHPLNQEKSYSDVEAIRILMQQKWLEQSLTPSQTLPEGDPPPARKRL